MIDKREQLQKKKLSYKEQRELDTLPQSIAALEAEQTDIQAALADGYRHFESARHRESHFDNALALVPQFLSRSCWLVALLAYR